MEESQKLSGRQFFEKNTSQEPSEVDTEDAEALDDYSQSGDEEEEDEDEIVADMFNDK